MQSRYQMSSIYHSQSPVCTRISKFTTLEPVNLPHAVLCPDRWRRVKNEKGFAFIFFNGFRIQTCQVVQTQSVEDRA